MKASAYIATSLDGFIAREDGDIDWLHSAGGSDEKEDYGYADFMASVDALIMGRNTFETALGFGAWPYTGKRVVVLSSRPMSIPDDLADTVAASSAPPLALLSDLEKQGINHVYVDGGKTIQGFLRAGLINELTITRIPILIGKGIPLFGTLDRDIRLTHLHTQAYATGLVQSKYVIVS